MVHWFEMGLPASGQFHRRIYTTKKRQRTKFFLKPIIPFSISIVYLAANLFTPNSSDDCQLCRKTIYDRSNSITNNSFKQVSCVDALHWFIFIEVSLMFGRVNESHLQMRLGISQAPSVSLMIWVWLSGQIAERKKYVQNVSLIFFYIIHMQMLQYFDLQRQVVFQTKDIDGSPAMLFLPISRWQS